LIFQEEIDTQTEVFETLMLGFRLNEGINKKAFHSRFGFSLSERYRKTIEELKGQGLLTEDTQALRPTSLGLTFRTALHWHSWIDESVRSFQWDALVF
jgi:oxygen-independent coproporphyrinogen-3 oxidase